VARVRATGGQAEEPIERPYGLLADCRDDQAMPFSLVQSPAGQQAPRGPLNGARHGDISYLTIGTGDSARFRTFFGGLFGWTFTPGHVADGWQAGGVVPMTGIYGGEMTPVVKPMYRVEDIAAAVERVRAGGGRATEPIREPYGLMSECIDDQGTRFYLGQH
jgi:predicted enzyme related to lactoylglutathione lyase